MKTETLQNSISQDKRWELHYAQVKTYIEQHRRLPSKHRVEDHRLLNWLKYNRKKLSAGTLTADRQARFRQLLEWAAQYQRINQHAYKTEREA